MTSRPRVTLASRIYPPDGAAAAFRLGSLAEALHHRGAQVLVLTARTRGRIRPRGAARVSRWPVLRDRHGYVRGYLPYLSFDVPLALRLLLVRGTDVVVVEPPPTTGAVVRAVLTVRSRGRGPHRPYVYYAADVWSDAAAATSAPRAVVSLLRRIERFALQGADEVVAVSPGVADRARRLGASSVRVVPNGIDTTVFNPERTHGERQRHGVPAGPFLLYAGTASEWQGAEIFAEAMRTVVRRVPSACVVFLGQGTSWPALRRLATELPEGALMLRPVAPAEVAAVWLRAASAALVSVRPGAGYDLAYPTKVLAALACGTDVVYAGPGPASGDLHEYRLGATVPYDVAAVADAMTAALRAAPDVEAAQQRVRWVTQRRSLGVSAAAAADVILGVATRAGSAPRRAG